jgi:hypothetical protein
MFFVYNPVVLISIISSLIVNQMYFFIIYYIGGKMIDKLFFLFEINIINKCYYKMR